jgi:hypothetical protein
MRDEAPIHFRARIASGPRKGEVLELSAAVSHLQTPEGLYSRRGEWEPDGTADFNFVGGPTYPHG